ncbi:MAG: hypothetical protein H7Y42_14670, partial [Chitinophagaceae bacterium]|nr:hypothetical protein [Chitinophagaceae bacterium]
MLIIVVVLGIFYPTIFSEISLLDDIDMVKCLFNLDKLDIRELFFPRNHQGGYYRPLIGVSFLIDKFVWGLESKIMHFENILLHLINTLLVFWLASLLINQRDGRNRYLPLVASLFFSLNPIVTESVNWISGRTDILAGVFVLLSAVCIIYFRKKRSYYLLVGSATFIFAGSLAKETVLGFIPAALLLLLCKDISSSEEGEENQFFAPIDLIYYLVFSSIAIISAIYFYNYWLVLGIGGAYLLMLSRVY